MSSMNSSEVDPKTPDLSPRLLSAQARGTMYSNESLDDETTTDESEADQQTVKPSVPNKQLEKFRQDLITLQQQQQEQSSSSEEDPDEFNIEPITPVTTTDPAILELVNRLDRLETVEEVTEPISSDYFLDSLPHDGARMSGQISSDFGQDSLPPDTPAGTRSVSITSREEMYSVTEIEITNTAPSNHFTTDESDKAASSNDNLMTFDDVFGLGQLVSHSSSSDVDKAQAPSSIKTGSSYHSLPSELEEESDFEFHECKQTDNAPLESKEQGKSTLLLTNLFPSEESPVQVGQEEDEEEEPTIKEVVESKHTGEESIQSTSLFERKVNQKVPLASLAAISLDQSEEGSNDSEASSLRLSFSEEKDARLKNQLSEVKTGILKLLTSPDDTEEEDSRKDEEDNNDGSRQNMYLVDVDDDDVSLEEEASSDLENDGQFTFTSKFSTYEKHEFENAEKDTSSTMGSVVVSGESVRANDGAADNDSGIEREGTLSRGGTAGRCSSVTSSSTEKIWTKFNRTVTRRFRHSSGGSSSPSPPESDRSAAERPPNPIPKTSSSSRDSLYSPEVAKMDSPREGGFQMLSDGGIDSQSKAMLKKHIKELYEKLQKAEDDKQKIADEAFLRAKAIQEEADAKLKSVHLSQTKQANLIDRLQSKVLQYKKQNAEMETRIFELNHVSNQSQIRLKDTTAVLKTLEERLRSSEERHSEEVKAIQVKLEEQQEKNNTLVQVNNILREQLDGSNRDNEKLLHDVTRYSKNWDSLKKEFSEKEEQWQKESLNMSTQSTVEHQKMLQLWRQVSALRRQFADMKMSTERDMVKMKSDVSQSTRELSTACLQVYTKSNFMNVDGKEIHIGSQRDLFAKVEKLKTEKQLYENMMNDMEDKLKKMRATVDELHKTLSEETNTNAKLKEEIERLKVQGSDRVEQTVRSVELETHNTLMQNSLFDIAQMVVEDADRQDREEGGGATVIVKPLLAGRSPGRNRSMAGATGERRTRSASPAMMESTLSAVQAALNRRQLQVHDLRVKLQNSQEKVDTLTKQVVSKSEILQAVEEKLDKERVEADRMKLSMDELNRERNSLQERFELLLIEKTSVDRSRTNLQEELDTITKEKTALKEEQSRMSKALQSAHTEIEHQRKVNDKLKGEMKEQQNFVSQLETSGGSLRTELMKLKDEIHKVVQERDVLRHEKSNSEQSATEHVEKSNTLEQQLTRLKKEEKSLRETVTIMEAKQDAMTTNMESLEDTVTRLEEEKLKLWVEIGDMNNTLQTMKAELLKAETAMANLRNENSALSERVEIEEVAKVKVENELKNLSKGKDDVDNQLTSVTLQKDALLDEVTHVRTEMSDLKSHLDRVYNENVALNRQKSELEVKVEQMAKELGSFEDRVNFLRGEKSDQALIIDEVTMELEETDNRKKQLDIENKELIAKQEKLTTQLKQLKNELNEETARAEAQKARCDEELEETRERYDKNIQKMKSKLEEAEEQRIKEKQELKKSLEKWHDEELEKIGLEHDEKLEQLRLELVDVTSQLERLKQEHAEEVVVAENSKQQALMMAQQEQTGHLDRLEALTREYEECQSELERFKREGTSRSEKDRNMITDLQMENSRLKGQLEEKIAKLEAEKESTNENLSRERLVKMDVEAEMEKLKTTLRFANEKVDDLSEQLQDTLRKLSVSEETRARLQTEVSEFDQRFMRNKQQVEMLEKGKFDLKETLKEMEVEKINQKKLIKEMETKLTKLEMSEEALKRELEEARNLYTATQGTSFVAENQVSDLKRQIKELKTQCQELEMQNESLQNRSKDEEDDRDLVRREAQQLRLRIHELENARVGLGRDLVSTKTFMTGEEETSKHRLGALTNALEELRVREKKLEDQRHNLEICLANSQQEVQDLNMKLTGYEGRVAELHTTIARLEAGKKDVETKLSGVYSILHQVIGSSSLQQQRPSTPTRFGRTPYRSPSWSRGQSPIAAGEIARDLDIESVRGNLKELISRMSQMERDRDEALHQIAALKRQNDELLVNNVTVEEQSTKMRQKLIGSEEQLRKLEHKISLSDINIANQDEELQKRERDLRLLSEKLDSTTKQLDEIRRRGSGSDEEVRRLRGIEARMEAERRRLQEALTEAEATNTRLEVVRKGMEGDNQRLHLAINEKDAEIKALKQKCDSLGRNVSNLEDKCTSLSTTVDQLQIQLDKSVQNESELQSKVSGLSRSLNQTSTSSHGIQDQVSQLQRAIVMAENEKKILEERLESSRNFSTELKKSQEALQDKVSHLQTELQRSESRANQAELHLQTTRTHLDSNVQDNYMREELGRLRQENANLQDRVKELNKKIAALETEKGEIERRMERKHSSPFRGSKDQVDHVRAQIPLLSSRSPIVGQCGDHLVKIRILEQENERYNRKIRGLEQQLADLEQIHGSRIQELLQERRRERDKENVRQKETIRQMETSLTARERIYKERIRGLEDQVDVLKDQLTKEMRRRQHFISSSTSMANEMSEIRSHLDKSLFNVSNDVKHLDREADRLNTSIDRFGPDYTSRLTPSKLTRGRTPSPVRLRSASSMDNLRTSTPALFKTKRTLKFDSDP